MWIEPCKYSVFISVKLVATLVYYYVWVIYRNMWGFFVVVVLGFELRAWTLLGRCSSTWATLIALEICFHLQTMVSIKNWKSGRTFYTDNFTQMSFTLFGGFKICCNGLIRITDTILLFPCCLASKIFLVTFF
jgi:hypothetical protein